MCDDMWDDHTEDIFQSITIKQALRTPPKTNWGNAGLLTKMWSQVKLWEESAFCRTINKFQYGAKPKGTKIKFRRYGNVETEETMVGGFICEAITTLGNQSQVWSTVGRNLSGYGDTTEFGIKEVQDETKAA